MGLDTLTLLLRVATIVLPPLFGYLAYRIARMLLRGEQEARQPAGARAEGAGA
jgi:hypothetical protein